MCLAQGHNAVMSVRLETVTPQSRVKHTTTQPLRSHYRIDLESTSHILVKKLKNPYDF